MIFKVTVKIENAARLFKVDNLKMKANETSLLSAGSSAVDLLLRCP